MPRQTLNDPTEVEASFAEDGTVRVRSFTRHGKRWPVFSQGRQWLDERDGRRHTLVMTARERVYELAYHAGEARWFIVMASEDRLMG